MIYTIISTGFENNISCKNENEKPYTTIKRLIRETVWELYLQGAKGFRTNCQYGVPLWAAEAICAMKLFNPIELHITVPYEEQCLRWSEEQRDRYYHVHRKADTVEFAQKEYSPDCYEKADKIMTADSGGLIVFGESVPVHVMRLAKELNVPLRHIDPATFL